MLSKIKHFFEQLNATKEPTEQEKNHATQLAVSVLLVEMMRMDGSVEHCEQQELNRLLNEQFQLNVDEKEELLQLSTEKLDESTDYYQFTAIINQHFDQDRKLSLIEDLWRVAFSDGELNPHEEHYLRKINSLLHISHNKFMRSKMIAKKLSTQTLFKKTH